jgi:hypothetical protein
VHVRKPTCPPRRWIRAHAANGDPHLRVLDNREKTELANHVLSHLLSIVCKTCSRTTSHEVHSSGVRWTDPEGAFKHLSPTYFQCLRTILPFAISACVFHASYRAWAANLFVRSLVRSTPTRLSAAAMWGDNLGRGDVGRQPRPWGDASEVGEEGLKGKVKKEGL